MTEVLRHIVSFRGGVSCRRETSGPLGLILIGRTSDARHEAASLAFCGVAPADLPEAIEDPSIECARSGHYRITAGPRQWYVVARSVYLHREVASRFYEAIPPRKVPWHKKVFWSVVLRLVASERGKRLLLALRR
ncbi:MAG TPA: hypothetical protein VJQ47_19300 [Steroidobacteraceae bacterium]|nr:hypothetical protein [Steroidobacteraceae bacterium]